MNPLDQLEWDFYDLGCDLHTGGGVRYPPSPGAGVRYLPSPRLAQHTRRLSEWLDGDEEFAFSCSRSASSQGWSSQDSHTYTRHTSRKGVSSAATHVLPRAGTKDPGTNFLPHGQNSLSVPERLPSERSLQTSAIKQREETTSSKRLAQTEPATALEEDGCTALHRAVVGGHVEVVQALIEEGASVDRQDQNGNTPLHEAAWNGYSRTVELLIKARANIHAKNENGFTPLHHAVQNGHSQSCRMLLMGGCWPDAKNNYGDTALHLAIKYGHVTSTRILLSARCNVDQRNKDGRTALHVAAYLGLRKLTKILVEANADVNAKDKDGKTPIDLARDKENPECILIMTSTPKGKRSGRGRSTHRKDNSNIRRSHSLPADGTNNKAKEQVSQQRKDKPVKRVQIQTSKDKHTRKHSPSIQVKSTPHVARFKESQDRLRHRHHHHHSTPAGKLGRSSQHPAQVPPHLLPQAFPHMYHMVRDQKGNLQKIPVYQCFGCTPYLQQMENKLEAHREELLAEIDDSHWALNSQLQQVERKCSHHAACLDQLCRERVSAEQTACLHRIDKRTTQDRRELEADTDTKVKSVRESLQAWMEQKYCSLQEKLERVTLSGQGLSSDVYRESQADRTTDRTWLGTSSYPLEKSQSEGVLLTGTQSRSWRSTYTHRTGPPTEHNHLHPTDDEKLSNSRAHTTWAATRSGDGLSARHPLQPSTSHRPASSTTRSQQLSDLWQDSSHQPQTKESILGVRANYTRGSQQSSLPDHGAYARVQDISPTPLPAAEAGLQLTRSKEQSTRTQASPHEHYRSPQDGRARPATTHQATSPTYTVQTSFMPQTNQFSLSSEELYPSHYPGMSHGDLCVDDSAISCDKSVSTSYLSYRTCKNDDSVLQSDSSRCSTVEQNSLYYMSTGRRGEGGGTEDNTGLPPDVHVLHTRGSHV